MSEENRNASLLAPSTSDVYFKDPSKSSRISYTRNFLLSLAKARTLKLSRDIHQFAMSCMFEGSLDLLPSPYTELDSVSQKVSASKALDNVTLLHKSNEPYLPPCRSKALSSSNGDSNGDSNDISGSSECTNQKQQEELEKCRNVSPTKFVRNDELLEYLEPPLIHDVQIQQDSEFKSSNTSLEDCSSFIPGFNFPDEESLTSYGGPFSALEVEMLPNMDDFMSSHESDLIEDDLDSPNSTFAMIKNLVESVLEDDDADYDDDYYNFDYDNYLMGEIMVELVQHGASISQLNHFYPLFHSNQLNLGSDPFSLSSLSFPCDTFYHGDHELRRFGLGADESIFEQGMMPSLEVPSWKEKTSLMQNCFEYQDPGYDSSVKEVPDSHGDGNGETNQAVVDSFVDMKLGANQFIGGFYKEQAFHRD